MYTRLFNGGGSYLTREVQSGFHQHFPMSSRAQKVVENNLDIIKAGVVKIATPLMKNESQLDIAATPVKWLTCIKVKGTDYLWDPEVEYEQKPEEEPEEEFEGEFEGDFEGEFEGEFEQEAELGAEQPSGTQPVSEKGKGKRPATKAPVENKGKRRAVEAPAETGPSIEPVRKKGKGRATMPFGEEDIDADENGDAEGEEV